MKKIYFFLYLLLLSVQFSMGQADQQMATVYFARSGFVGSAVKLHVFHESEYIGALRGSNTIKVEVLPGKQFFYGLFPNNNMTSILPMDLKGGEDYYILGKLGLGSMDEFLYDVTTDPKLRGKVKKKMKKENFQGLTAEERLKYEQRYKERLALASKATDAAPQEPESEVLLTSASSEPIPEATQPEQPETTSAAPYTTGLTDTPSNLREKFFQQLLKAKAENTTGPVGGVAEETAVIGGYGETGKVRHSEDNNEAALKYRRSSLYTMMINDTIREHYGVIRDAFGNFGLSEKFNDHNIGPYLIDTQGKEKEEERLETITEYLAENGVARDLVAKWFNRDASGTFNMDLVASRGSYNASDLEVMVAQDSKRGAALLADAGEELIGNTFIIVNDYKYVNKEEVAQKASGILNAISDVASIAGYDEVALAASAVSLGTSAVGKGYVVKTTSYLYRLEWNDEIANTFYSSLWVDKESYDENKVAAFNTSDLFKLKVVGLESAWADLQSSVFTQKSGEDLIRIATVKATHKAISKLQRKFEEFRTKSPLLSGDPIAAKIGLKEGLEKGDKFEVLEQVIDKDGRTTYKRVGKIKVDKNHIWNNSFLAEETEEELAQEEEYTLFKGPEGKYYSGMLIRQIN